VSKIIVPGTAEVTPAAEVTQGKIIPLLPIPNSNEILGLGVTLSASVLIAALPIAIWENARLAISMVIMMIIFFIVIFFKLNFSKA
jgi:hypothetical protein